MKVYIDEKDDDVYPDDIDMKGKLSIWFEESECGLEPDIELHLLSDHDKEIRKQICDEIEDKLCDLEFVENDRSYIDLDEALSIIDQIEKGE